MGEVRLPAAGGKKKKRFQFSLFTLSGSRTKEKEKIRSFSLPCGGKEESAFPHAVKGRDRGRTCPLNPRIQGRNKGEKSSAFTGIVRDHSTWPRNNKSFYSYRDGKRKSVRELFLLFDARREEEGGKTEKLLASVP